MQKTIVIDDLFKLQFLQDAQFSPDGLRVAYAVSKVVADEAAEIESERELQKTAIWILSLETQSARMLTTGEHEDTSPRWSPDGKRIAFLSDRAEQSQIYIIPFDGGEAQALTKLKQGVGSSPTWSPDGTQIAFTAGPARKARDPGAPYRIVRHIFRFDDLGYIDDVIQDIYIAAVGGGEPRRLTSDENLNGNLAWSPDGAEIAFTATMMPSTHQLYTGLCAVNLEGRTRNIVSDWEFISPPAWTPNGEQIVFIGRMADARAGSKSDLWIVASQGGEPKPRTSRLKNGVGGSLIADFPTLSDKRASPLIKIAQDGRRAYVQGKEGGSLHLYEIALRGTEEHGIAVGGERSCILLDAHGSRLLYAVSALDNPTELSIFDTKSGEEQQLTQLNADFLAQRTLQSVEQLIFSGNDGEQVEGWLLKPPEGRPPYATILYIHGGPHSGFGHMFSFDFQMLTGAGYAVLLINQRGSTGYGDEFAGAITGDWGNLDYEDLMAGVDHVIALGLADPERLGCCGLSGGGNLSCWIVGHTDRFKAAVPENPLTNWVSFYGVSDIGPWFSVKELGGHPHEIPQTYSRCSPLTYAHRCTTPTLLVQGEDDFRCPAEQAEQFYAVLKANGCEVEMLRLPDSSHAGSIRGAPTVRRAQNEALLDWMNRHVLR
ncbi:MAG: S9 family peptidase [Chloroflexi bacterium]|nr:S9 family peptidase [Chloroflexota bacterium]